MQDQLLTYDPYDIWKTKIGYYVKKLYNYNKLSGLPFAALLTFFDIYINNKTRLLYKKQEYPIVRAFAAMSLINLYRRYGNDEYITHAKKHIDWLVDNACSGYSGYCWGIRFKYPVTRNLIYDDNTPFATITPYVLEALHQYNSILRDNSTERVIKSIFDFLDKDIQVIYQDDHSMATSYGPVKDRIVINSLSYTMYAYSLLAEYYLDDKSAKEANSRASKIYNYIASKQNMDGAWFYSVDCNSFIDCFHSCFVLKNIIKTKHYLDLHDSDSIITRGYNYLLENFYDHDNGLFRRFSVSNKYSLIKFDLYDNAEMLNLAYMLNDSHTVKTLCNSIEKNFFEGVDLYSQLTISGIRVNKDTLRWAVMPYIYALSKIYK